MLTADEVRARLNAIRLMLDDLEAALMPAVEIEAEPLDVGPSVFGPNAMSYTIKHESPRSTTLGPITASEIESLTRQGG